MTIKAAPVGGAEVATSNHTPATTKRAFAYVRVSSDAQASTGFARDGLSINAQREAAQDKATQLGAELIHVWSDPGRSAYVDLAKRVEFLEMLDEIKQLNRDPATRIDFVIVWSLSRWSRNVQDHHRTVELVKKAGTRIVSITEPMIGEEDTPESFYMEGMFALNNQYESMKTGRNVSKGILQKAKEGGTYGPAKLGYVNGTDLLPDGRKVACVEFDPQRHAYITAAFKLFVSGDYSITGLSDELYTLGLRSRPDRRHPNSKLKVQGSTLHRLLRDPYYAGWILYKKGKPDEQMFPARHKPLIDQDTFDQVQELLDMARVSGERTGKHQHYLKGTVYCAECEGRMVYAPSRSKNGNQYAYLFCSTRLPGRSQDCHFTESVRPEMVEEAMQRLYDDGPINLSTDQVKERTAAIEGLAVVSQAATEKVRAAKTELIGKLEGEQVRLIRLEVQDGGAVSSEAFKRERERMDRDIAAARKSLAATEAQMNLDSGLLRMALELAENVGEVYRTAEPQLRRALNQALFKHVWITPVYGDDGRLSGAEVKRVGLTQPYEVLAAASFAKEAHSATAWISQGSGKKKGSPGGTAFLRSVFDLDAYGGEGGIRTLERAFAPYSLSRRVPSATRPPLRATRTESRRRVEGL
jgi:site-specific DNA recombinase